MAFCFSELVKWIQKSQNILLTTHRNCDGDGLGSLLAVHHALLEMGKQPHSICIDKISKRYSFLNTEIVQIFEEDDSLPQKADLLIVFDTNDHRLVEPLISQALEKNIPIVYLDHHPILSKGPKPTETSIIDVGAASTAELAYQLIELLKVPLNPKIAEALYTSIIFDTQVFRFIKASPDPFLISAKLLNFIDEPSSIHKKLFAHQSPQKVRYLGTTLKQLKLFHQDKVAYLFLDYKTRKSYGVSEEETLDIIDFLAEIRDLEFACVLRENEDSTHKMSLRSLGPISSLAIAEEFGGGGHVRASGSTIWNLSHQSIEKKVLKLIEEQLSPVSSQSPTLLQQNFKKEKAS